MLRDRGGIDNGGMGVEAAAIDRPAIRQLDLVHDREHFLLQRTCFSIPVYEYRSYKKRGAPKSARFLRLARTGWSGVVILDGSLPSRATPKSRLFLPKNRSGTDDFRHAGLKHPVATNTDGQRRDAIRSLQPRHEGPTVWVNTQPSTQDGPRTIRKACGLL